jgi:hypothetical protein
MVSGVSSQPCDTGLGRRLWETLLQSLLLDHAGFDRKEQGRVGAKSQTDCSHGDNSRAAQCLLHDPTRRTVPHEFLNVLVVVIQIEKVISYPQSESTMSFLFDP